MSISNELTSDLATALADLLKNEVEADPKDLAVIVHDFQTALRPLEAEAHRRRFRYQRTASASTGPLVEG
jgi:hypothetical protein